MLEQIQSGMTLQAKYSQLFARTLEKTEQTIRMLEPMAEGMQRAASDIQGVSSQTSSVVQVIRGAAEVQDNSVRQQKEMSQHILSLFDAHAKQMDSFSSDMVVLQDVLGKGVEAFASRLPKSVHQSLLQFDEVMGEGVARLGSAVERLREAMDDLLESLEAMKTPKKKR